MALEADAYPMPMPEVLIAKAAERFDAEGRLTDEATRRFVTSFLSAFESWVRRFRG
jgi:chromate reductase